MNDLNETFINNWKEERKMNIEETRVFWDTKAHSYNKGVYEKNQRKSQLAESFFGKGIINKDSKVLDIGAGPGNYAIPFAKLVSDVTALDISDEMVKYLKENAQKEGLKNISAFQSSWEELDTDTDKFTKQYDLVFASMTPAVSSYESLIKMIDASRSYCYLSGFVYRQDSIWDEIREKILKKDKDEEKQNKIYYAFNILWNMGMHPEIEYYEREHVHKYETRDLIDMYTQKAKSSAKDISKEEIEQIEKFIRSKEDNNIVEENMKSKSAALIWKVL